MVRTIAGALLILATCFLARGPSLIPEGRPPVRGDAPAAAGDPSASPHNARAAGLNTPSRRDSASMHVSRPDSAQSRRPRSKQKQTVPAAFVRNPLAFLSRAPVDSLVLLKGIGPVLAERIAVARSGKGPFTSWEDILSIPGIGPKKVSKLKEQAQAAE